MEWTYGVLASTIENNNVKGEWLHNPIYFDNILIFKNKAIQFNIKGTGKLTQISFTSDSKDATIAFTIDDKKISLVNNGHCLSKLCDTRGLGCIQIQEIESISSVNACPVSNWRYTCLIPVIFNKKVSISVGNESHKDKDIKVSNLHIYYLVPWRENGTD